jgi:histidine phosphotransfer protein HptB
MDPTGSGPLDESELIELRDLIGLDGVAELVDLFVEDSVERLSAIETAVSHADAKEIRSAAHAYKGTAAGVGARHVAAIAREMENDARDGRVDRAPDQASRLREATQTATASLKSFVGAA